MAKNVARYSVTFGLKGCYMPDSSSGPYEFTRRKDFAEFIRDELRQYDMPACRFRDVGMRSLWRMIQKHGSSAWHFSLDAGEHNELSFHGLTEEEFNEMDKENE